MQKWTPSQLDTLANAFGVSLEAAVVRLIGLGRADASLYARMRGEFALRTASAKQRTEDREGGPSYHRVVVSHNGRAFTRLVIEAFEREAITERRAANYLGVSHEHLPKIEHEVRRRA